MKKSRRLKIGVAVLVLFDLCKVAGAAEVSARSYRMNGSDQRARFSNVEIEGEAARSLYATLTVPSDTDSQDAHLQVKVGRKMICTERTSRTSENVSRQYLCRFTVDYDGEFYSTESEFVRARGGREGFLPSRCEWVCQTQWHPDYPNSGAGVCSFGCQQQQQQGHTVPTPQIPSTGSPQPQQVQQEQQAQQSYGQRRQTIQYQTQP